MKATLMANANSPRRSQKAGVSAGSSASEAARGREKGASRGDIGASNGEIGAARLALTASRAEGPVGAKPGRRPAQPLQNIALSRFRLPQVLHTTDMSKPPEWQTVTLHCPHRQTSVCQPVPTQRLGTRASLPQLNSANNA